MKDQFTGAGLKDNFGKFMSKIPYLNKKEQHNNHKEEETKKETKNHESEATGVNKITDE